MKTCIFFDNDGTLVDSERLNNIGLSLKFKEYGLILDVEELTSKYRGWKLANILENITHEFDITLAENFVESYRVLISDLFTKELKPIPHVEEALRNIEHSKAVVSSGPPEKIRHALRICGLEKHFGDNIYSSYEMNVWKPDPRAYLIAAQDMGYQPSDCIVVEDSMVGVEAGYNSGMKTLFFNRFNETCRYKSVINFKSMKELIKLI